MQNWNFIWKISLGVSFRNCSCIVWPILLGRVVSDLQHKVGLQFRFGRQSWAQFYWKLLYRWAFYILYFVFCKLCFVFGFYWKQLCQRRGRAFCCGSKVCPPWQHLKEMRPYRLSPACCKQSQRGKVAGGGNEWNFRNSDLKKCSTRQMSVPGLGQ